MIKVQEKEYGEMWISRSNDSISLTIRNTYTGEAGSIDFNLKDKEDVRRLSALADEPVSYTHLTLPTNREV